MSGGEGGLRVEHATALREQLRQQRWAVVDVETTGGSPARGHRVTEIAAVAVDGGRITERWSTLVNPGRRIPPQITGLTGISDEMVRDAPPFACFAAELSERLSGRVFVAHNAGFDWRFVGAEMERATGRFPVGRQLCTVRLARKLLPHLPSRSLGALAEVFDLRMEAHHRALADATATARLLLIFLEMLGEREIHDWTALDAWFSRRPARRGRRRAMPHSMERAP